MDLPDCQAFDHAELLKHLVYNVLPKLEVMIAGFVNPLRLNWGARLPLL